MSAELLSLSGHSVLPEPDWPQKLEQWCERLAACAHKPSRRRVHGVRSSTLRLQAELDEILRHGTLSLSAARAVERWSRKSRRVRKVLATVRDADVCLGLLVTFHGADVDAGHVEPPEARDSLRGMKDLERSLRHTREAARKRMSLALEALQPRIEKAARELGQQLAGAELARFDSSAALEAVTTELTVAAQRLSPDTLHAFRKLAKTGRYLAENSPQPNARAQDVAEQCRAIQTAVGNWRDWTLLSEHAHQLASRREGGALARELEATSQRLLNEALKQCLRSTAVLSSQTQYDLTRKPVESARRQHVRLLA